MSADPAEDNSELYIRHRNQKVDNEDYSDTQIQPQLYIKEELSTIRAEFDDSVISYDPLKLADVLQSAYATNSKSSEKRALISELTDSAISYIASLFTSKSPVIVAFSQYKSAGYPWAIGCLPSSSIAILAISWLEISPPLVATEKISTLINTSSDDAAIDPLTPESDDETAASTSPAEKASPFTEWQRRSLSYVDPFPQWRILALHTNQFVAIGYSNGDIEVIDLSAESSSHQVLIKHAGEGDFAPLVGLFFLHDASHLLACRFSGEVELWHLKPQKSGYSAHLVCQKRHHSAIFSAAFDPERNLLALGGEFSGSPANQLTIFAIDDLSTLRQFSLPRGESGVSLRPSRFRSFLRSLITREDTNPADGFASLSISPEKTLLSALHCSRAISLWSFPSCSLITNIISDAVPLNSLSITCKPLSPLLSAKTSVPLRLEWWKQAESEPLMVKLMTDGRLSIIDSESRERELFSVDQRPVKHIDFDPFTCFSLANAAESTKAEVFLLNCVAENDVSEKRKPSVTSRPPQSYLSSFAAALGITGGVDKPSSRGEEADEVVSTVMRATVVRIAATSKVELFTHRLRSCRFDEALKLAREIEGIDEETVWQYQLLALFYIPLEPLEFESKALKSIGTICRHVNWMLRMCLHALPPVNDSWKPADLFRATRRILEAGAAGSSSPEVGKLFHERLYHLEVLTKIYTEESARSMSTESTNKRGVNHWRLEIEAYRQSPPLDIGLWYLHTGRYAAFGILFAHYYSLLSPHLIGLLETLPATESPAEYLEPITVFPDLTSAQQPPMNQSLIQLHTASVQRLASRLPKDFRWNKELSVTSLAQWACTRAYEIDTASGITSYSQELLKSITEIVISSADQEGNAKVTRAKKRALAVLKRCSDDVEQFATILYRCASGYSFSTTLQRRIDLSRGNFHLSVSLSSLRLAEFHEFSPEQRLELLIRVCISAPAWSSAADICTVLEKKVIPFIGTYEAVGSRQGRLKWALLQVAGFAKSGLEAIALLAEHFASEASISLPKGVDLPTCLLDFLGDFSQSDCEEEYTYLSTCQRILAPLPPSERRRRMSECASALLDYHDLVRELGYLKTPRGTPTSLGEAIAVASGDETRLTGLVNRWIRTTIVALGETALGESKDTDTAGVAASSLKIVKRLYFYGRGEETSTTTTEEVAASSTTDESEKPLIEVFQRLCNALTRLLGTDTNEEARYHLLAGVLTSGDRRFIDFASSALVKSPSDVTWLRAVANAVRVYFDCTPVFGLGEVNESLGAHCLSLLPPNSDPHQDFYGAVKFLVGIDRLRNRTPSLPFSRSDWMEYSQEQKTAVFTTALGDLIGAAYLSEVNLCQAGRLFGLSPGEVDCCFLQAALDSTTGLPTEAAEKTVEVMRRVLSTPQPSAWPQMRLWSLASARSLSSLFPGVRRPAVERFRLTLARFVLVHSVSEASAREYAQILEDFSKVCASQLPAEALNNSSSVTQRLLSAFSSKKEEESIQIGPQPHRRCSLYLSPLDPTGLEEDEEMYSHPTQSELLRAFLTNTSDASVQEAWIHDCVTAPSLDIGLSYAYGPPVGVRPRSWTKLVCSQVPGEAEEYRVQVATLSVSQPPPSGRVFPPRKILVESLKRVAGKHPRIAGWLSKVLVSRLVQNPHRFFADVAYRQQELLNISQTNRSVSLLLAKHMKESRSQLVLSNLTEIVFTPGVEAGVVKSRLKEISPYLKRDVPLEELQTYLDEFVENRGQEMPLKSLLLLLKVFLVVAGGEKPLYLLGVDLKRHVEFLKSLISLPVATYFAFLEALKKPTGEEFLASVRSHLTSKLDVECLITILHQWSCQILVKDTEVYAIYASSLLEKSDWPVPDCIDCFDAMITAGGDASVLADWIGRETFGRIRSLDLEARHQLAGAAVQSARKLSADEASVKRLEKYEKDLQKRADWLESWDDRDWLSGELLDALLWHDCAHLEEVPSLLHRVGNEFLSGPQKNPLAGVDVVLGEFIALLERITQLLCEDSHETTIVRALCAALNEFFSLRLSDWVYLSPTAEQDLSSADRIISTFVESKGGLSASLLLSHPRPRQLFGRILLSAGENPPQVAQSALDHVLEQFELPLTAMQDSISKLIGWLQGHELAALDWLEGEAVSSGLIQATAVAIELAALCESNLEKEEVLWRTWLKAFVNDALLVKFPRKLISLVHLTREPSRAYVAAVGGLETNDERLREAIESVRLFGEPGDTPPLDVKLDPVACRRYLNATTDVKSQNWSPSMLAAMQEVARDPRYEAFLKKVLRRMQEAGDVWLEIVAIARDLFAKKRHLTTMEAVLKALEEFFSSD